MRQITVVIVGILATVFIFFNNTPLASLQTALVQSNQTPIPTTTVPTVQITSTPGQTSITWGIEVIIIPLVSLLLGVLITVLAHLYRETKQASQTALESKIKVESASGNIQRIDDKLSSLESKHIDLSQKVYELNSRSQTISFQVDEFNKKVNGAYIPNTNEQLSLNSQIESLDENIISPDEYVEQQQWYSWRKWVNRKSETGWQELLEYACQEGGLVSSLCVAIESELDRIQQKLASESSPSQKDRDYASRLNELLDINKTVKR